VSFRSFFDPLGSRLVPNCCGTSEPNRRHDLHLGQWYLVPFQEFALVFPANICMIDPSLIRADIDARFASAGRFLRACVCYRTATPVG
jgi:hypothetical protein